MSRRPPRRTRPVMLVTGGSGFLGRQFVDGATAAVWDVVAPSSEQLDIRDRRSVHDAVEALRPDAIVHAAYRRDDRAAIVDGTRHIAEAAAATDARLVFVSTDVVFPGRAAPFTESDEPAPIHGYGRAKADAEVVVGTHCPTAAIARTSLILSAAGTREAGMSAHERAVAEALSGRTAMTFFTDEVRCPVLVDDLAGALAELARRTEISGPIHLAGPDPISRADLACLIAWRYGWDATQLSLAPMGELRNARPDQVVLDSSRAAALGLVVRGPRHW